MGNLLQHKIFLMAIMITAVGIIGIIKYPDNIDKFIGLISTVWGTFVGAQLDMNKERQ